MFSSSNIQMRILYCYYFSVNRNNYRGFIFTRRVSVTILWVSCHLSGTTFTTDCRFYKSMRVYPAWKRALFVAWIKCYTVSFINFQLIKLWNCVKDLTAVRSSKVVLSYSGFMLFIILFLASCVINEGDLNIRDARPKIVRWLGKHQWKRMKFQNILQMLFGQTLLAYRRDISLCHIIILTFEFSL